MFQILLLNHNSSLVSIDDSPSPPADSPHRLTHKIDAIAQDAGQNKDWDMNDLQAFIDPQAPRVQQVMSPFPGSLGVDPWTNGHLSETVSDATIRQEEQASREFFRRNNSTASSNASTVGMSDGPFSNEERSRKDQLDMSRITALARSIFQSSAKGKKGIEEPQSSSSYPDQYVDIFNSTQSLVKTIAELCPSKDPASPGQREALLPNVGDAEILMILTCYLKLLEGYDQIFDVWLGFLNPTQLNNTPSSMYTLILNFLPPVSIGLFLAPTCHTAQVRLLLEIASKMYHELGQSLEHITERLSNRDKTASMETISFMADTTAELVMSRKRAVGSKQDSVLKMIEDKEVQRKLEYCLSTIQGGNGDRFQNNPRFSNNNPWMV